MEIQEKLLDSSKINDLGWSADTDLLEGLKKIPIVGILIIFNLTLTHSK